MVMELGWKVGAVFSYMVLMLLSFVGDNLIDFHEKTITTR